MYLLHPLRARHQPCEPMSSTDGGRPSFEQLLGKAVRRRCVRLRGRFLTKVAGPGIVTDDWTMPARVWPFGLYFLMFGPALIAIVVLVFSTGYLSPLLSVMLTLGAAVIVVRRSLPVLSYSGRRIRVRSLFRTRRFDLPLTGHVRWNRFGVLVIALPDLDLPVWGAHRLLVLPVQVLPWSTSVCARSRRPRLSALTNCDYAYVYPNDPINQWDLDGLAKGGNQNKRDSGLRDRSDQEIRDAYDGAKGKDRKRYETELKARGVRNQDKDRTAGDVRFVVLGPADQLERNVRVGQAILDQVDRITDSIAEALTDGHGWWNWPVPLPIPWTWVW